MIIIDHIGMGVFNSYVTFKRISKKILFLGIIFSVLCDIDILWSGWAGSLTYLEFHRVWSHSLAIIIPLIVATTLLTKIIKIKFLHDITTKEIIIIQVLGFGSHLILDVFTPYGVPLFYPFSDYRYSIDLLHDFDPITSVISILSITLLLYVGKKKFSTKLIFIILITYFGYISYVIINKEYHQNLFSERFSESSNTTIKMIPKTFWRWKGLKAFDDKLVHINNISEPETLETLRSDIISNHFKNSEVLKIFFRYARFPAMAKMNDSITEFYNLAYSKENYKLTVISDSNHLIRSYETTSFDLIDE